MCWGAIADPKSGPQGSRDGSPPGHLQKSLCRRCRWYVEELRWPLVCEEDLPVPLEASLGGRARASERLLPVRDSPASTCWTEQNARPLKAAAADVPACTWEEALASLSGGGENGSFLRPAGGWLLRRQGPPPIHGPAPCSLLANGARLKSVPPCTAALH